jgi:acylphosphatase
VQGVGFAILWSERNPMGLRGYVRMKTKELSRVFANGNPAIIDKLKSCCSRTDAQQS